VFNHDEDAAHYDSDVKQEQHPIRAGYAALLEWVIESAAIRSDSRVLDLGVGTGNLSCQIPACAELIGVDVSEVMMQKAKPKLAHLKNVSFLRQDLLEFFEHDRGLFDVIISSYTIHHLTEAEKNLLLQEIWKCLRPGGRSVFGDLMVENAAMIPIKISEYEARGDNDTAESLREEFFWHLDTAEEFLHNIGFMTSIQRFSDFSFGIVAQKPR
jgi:putative AdoMet-dependent methyltransferase